MLGIHWTKKSHHNRSEYLAVWLVAIVTLAQALIEIVSLGRVSCDWRGKLLFSEFIDRLTDN